MNFLPLVLVLSSLCNAVTAYKILFICAVPSPSHSLWCYKYVAALAERGHVITVFGVDKPKFQIPNLTTFIANDVYDPIRNMTSGFTGQSKIGEMYPLFDNYNKIATNFLLHSKTLKDLLKHYKNEKKPFDLIIHDNPIAPALLALVPIFGDPPLVLATTYGAPQWMTLPAGNIFNPAYVPSMISNPEQHMNFYQRCVNTFYYVFLEYFYNFITLPFQEKIVRDVFGDGLPSVKDIAKRANIIIVNNHYALNGARPFLPGVIPISGLHISEPKPLPQDIKDFMDGAKDGAILFSFGTNVNSDWLPKNFEQTVLKGLSQLPQRVLWKWDKILPNLPSNIKMSEWLPQGDMLVHPNMRLFITHCGLLSTQEAMYRKVPVLALPVFLDQLDNAAFMVKKNLTIQLDVNNLTAEKLRDGIKEILSNPVYKTNMKKMGELLTDTPLTPRELAVYWTEYAVRHAGAPHLHSRAADMPWHQLLLFDVIGALCLILFVIMWLVKTILSFVFKKIFFSKIKTKSD